MKNFRFFSWKNILSKSENKKILARLRLRTQYEKFCKSRIELIQSESSTYSAIDLEEILGHIARVDERKYKYYPFVYDQMLNALTKILARDAVFIEVIAKVRDSFYQAEKRFQDQVLLFFVEEMQIQLILFLYDDTINFEGILKLYSHLITDSFTFQILLAALQSTINESKSFKYFKNQNNVRDIIQLIENYKAADLAKNTSHHLIHYFPYFKTKHTSFNLLILAILMISCLSSSISCTQIEDIPLEDENDIAFINEVMRIDNKQMLNYLSEQNFKIECKNVQNFSAEIVATHPEQIKKLWTDCYSYAERNNLISEQKYFLTRLLELDSKNSGYLLRLLSIAENNYEYQDIINLAPRLLETNGYKGFASAMLLISHFNLNDYDKVVEYGKEVMKEQQKYPHSCYARALLQYTRAVRNGFTYFVHKFDLETFNFNLENARYLAERNLNTGLLKQIRIFINNVYDYNTNGERSILYRIPLNEKSLKNYNTLNESECDFSKEELLDYFDNDYGLLLKLDDYEFSDPDHKATIFYDFALERPRLYETYLENSTFIVFKKAEDQHINRARVLDFDKLASSVGAVVSPSGEIVQKQKNFLKSFSLTTFFVLLSGLFVMFMSSIILSSYRMIAKFGREKQKKYLALQEQERLKGVYVKKINDFMHRFAQGELDIKDGVITVRTRNYITTLDLTNIDCHNPYSLRSITVDPKMLEQLLKEDLQKALQSFSRGNLLTIQIQDPVVDKASSEKFISKLDNSINQLFKKICNHLIKVSPENKAKEKAALEQQSKVEFEFTFQKKHGEYQKEIARLDPLQMVITQLEKSAAELIAAKSEYTPHQLPFCLAVISCIDKIVGKIQTLQPLITTIKKHTLEKKIDQQFEIEINNSDNKQVKINFLENKLQELKGELQEIDTRISEITELQKTLRNLREKSRLEVQELLRKEREEAARQREEQIRLVEQQREIKQKEKEDERQRQIQKERLKIAKLEKKRARQAQVEAKQQQEKKRQEEAERQALEKLYARIQTDVRLTVGLDCLDILKNALDQKDQNESNLLYYCKEVRSQYKLVITGEALLQLIVLESVLYSLIKMSHAVGQLFSYEYYNLKDMIDSARLYSVRNNIMHKRHLFADRSQLIFTFATECQNLLQESLSPLRRTGMIHDKVDLTRIKTEFLLNKLDDYPVDKEICLCQIATAAERLFQFYLVAQSLCNKHFTLYSNNNVLLTAMHSCVIAIGKYLNSLQEIDKLTYYFLCDELFKNKSLYINVEKEGKTMRKNIYSYYRKIIGHHFSDDDTNENKYKHVAGSGIYTFEEISPQSLLHLAKESETFFQTAINLYNEYCVKIKYNALAQPQPKSTSNLNPNAAPFVFNPIKKEEAVNFSSIGNSN